MVCVHVCAVVHFNSVVCFLLVFHSGSGSVGLLPPPPGGSGAVRTIPPPSQAPSQPLPMAQTTKTSALGEADDWSDFFSARSVLSTSVLKCNVSIYRTVLDLLLIAI